MRLVEGLGEHAVALGGVGLGQKVAHEDKQLLLVKFIQHNQSAEFIEVYKMFKGKDGKVDDCTETMGKSLLHLAVEYGSTKIVEFLLFET